MTTTLTTRRFAMLTDSERMLHETVDLPVTSILFDSRSGTIHKMGTPDAIAVFAVRFAQSLALPGLGIAEQLTRNATVVTADFTPDEITRFANEPRSILRDLRVRALPTTPTWHECMVAPINGVVPAAEAHLAWTSSLDGQPFGRHESHEDAEQALMDECAAIAPLKARI